MFCSDFDSAYKHYFYQILKSFQVHVVYDSDGMGIDETGTTSNGGLSRNVSKDTDGFTKDW